MASSRSADSDFSSALCSGVNRLEVPFFIRFAFVCGGLPGADDGPIGSPSSDSLRSGMNHRQLHWPNKSNGVPTITVRVRVRVDAWSGSSNTSTAVSNDKPCLTRFTAALWGATSSASPLRRGHACARGAWTPSATHLDPSQCIAQRIDPHVDCGRRGECRSQPFLVAFGRIASSATSQDVTTLCHHR